MRKPAKIKRHMTDEQLQKWSHSATDKNSHKMRMAIWLTHNGGMYANKVAKTLGVSVPAVWLWISQYNAKGPKGLERKGRGGRRWGYLTAKEEKEFLRPFMKQASTIGNAPKVSAIKSAMHKKLRKKVSLSYIYSLLERNHWNDSIAMSRSRKKINDTFAKFSRPWKI